MIMIKIYKCKCGYELHKNYDYKTPDKPVMAGCILLRKTMSLGLYLQQKGRALRKFPGKENAIILDHAGNHYLHGHVLAEREWSLDAQSRKKCMAVKCPKCGEKIEVEK